MADRGRGHGQRGGRGNELGRGASSAGGTPNGRICFDFQKGNCKRTNCKFAHIDRDHDDRRNVTPINAIDPEKQREARKSYNAWKRFLACEPTDSSAAKRLWKGALKILEDGDRDCQQQLARDLDSDDKNYKGRQHIAVVMGQRVRNGDSERFIKNSGRFLLLITHPSFVHCLAVETFVGSIYNFISGANGTRAVPFFQHLCETLVAARLDGGSATIPLRHLESTLDAMAFALRELLKLEQRVCFNEDLEKLLDALCTAADIFAPETPTSCSTHVKNHVRCMRGMVARLNGRLAKPVDDDDASSASRSTYPRDLIIPDGRHDNDKRDITDIVIFPTRDEIMSEVEEFLPFTDPDQPHFVQDPALRHIDTHFRLYRHDVFGELKATLAGLMQVLNQDKLTIANPRLQIGDMRAYNYDEARVRNVEFDRALEFHLVFSPPLGIRRKGLSTQIKWWDETNRLANGSLLSFIWIEGDHVQHVFLTIEQKKFKGRGQNVVTYDDDGRVTVIARLVTQDKVTLDTLMNAYARNVEGILLEFPNIIPGTFGPVLENLQDMQRLGGMSFQEYIVAQPIDGTRGAGTSHDVPPPLYAREAGFTFPLAAITKCLDDFSIFPTSSSDDDDLLDKVQARTSLDRGQCQALVGALTREFAFIQGQPGTGKSYLGVHLMRVLLSVKTKAKLGPILVVCYTNHALDQFLEHLIDVGITKIIRVGGMSKSTKLAAHNLERLRRMESKTKPENYLAAQAYKALDNTKNSANGVLDDLRQAQRQATWHELNAHICEEYPDISCQFNEVDDEGFKTVGRHPFDVWGLLGADGPDASVPGHATPPVDDIIRKATINVYTLSHAERLVLIDHWIREMQEAKIGELFGIVEDAADAQKQLHKIHSESSRRVLQDADVIGLTTTGLASRMSLLKHVASKVLICEEAGEIVEPHMLSALLPTIEHCIQIGDHEQLRPSISNFGDLSMESERGKLHQLDKSQFERLSVGESGRPSVPVAQLNVQRRMRPEISTLIRKTIYNKLVDHDTTAVMPDVVGMRKNVFWFDHRILEDGKQVDIQHSKSKSNTWEVGMVHALVKHIVRQGVYDSTDIAVLTPYTGQVQKLRTVLSSDFEIVISEQDEEALQKDGFEIDKASNDDGSAPKLEKKALTDLLRVATVDNFQGEEAKVVIISLVRSNIKRNVGFLRTTNRVNVLLSRAKHGMYLIGNSDTYSTVNMWGKVIEMLRTTNAVGPALGLCCPRHPNTIMEIKNAADFARFSPEGGCREMCADRLDCGHRCGAKCHSEALHSVFRCEAACERRHEFCNHACQKASCGEPCGECEVRVNGVQLACGHVANRIPCHRTRNLSEIVCNVVVTKKVPGCDHNILARCSQDVTQQDFRCTMACKEPLPCGHLCSGTCGNCTQNGRKIDGKAVVSHMDCITPCGRKKDICHHICDRKCHDGPCGPCDKICNVQCAHSRCPKMCQRPCAPCIRPCDWACEHQGSCSLPCSAACDRLPCDIRCTKTLKCGHQCPSICGERCGEGFCQQCGTKSDDKPDMVELRSYSEIDLNETPIIVLECGHFFTVETLDGHVGLNEVYKQDSKTGSYAALIDNAELAVKTPQCPNCRVPIRQYATQRYNRLSNKAVIDDMTKRFIISGHSDLEKLQINFQQLSSDMELSRQAVVPKITIPIGDSQGSMRRLEMVKYIVNSALKERYRDARQLERHVEVFQKDMATSNQPAGKLHQATMFARAKATTLMDDIAKLNLQNAAPAAPPKADLRIEQGGRILQIKTQCLKLEDKLEITRLMKAKYSADLIEPKVLGGHLVSQANTYLTNCISVVEGCNKGNLPKLAVEATLYHSRIAQVLGSSGIAKNEDRKTVKGHQQSAENLLNKAAKLCELPFRGAKSLGGAVGKSLKLLEKDFYTEVTKEEIEAVKVAMVSGPAGIATHSGHWYKCVNDHPVSFFRLMA